MKNQDKSKRSKTKKILWVMVTLFTLAIAVSIPLSVSAAFAYAGDSVSWGVRPNTNEQTPEPPKNGAALLEKYGGLFVGDTSKKEVLFTFDLGYEAGYTEAVLDILKQHDIKAIFFLCGNYLKEEVIINRMLAEGHQIGNHTNHHKDLPTISSEAIAKDITDFDIKYKAAFPDAPALTYFRPPKGNFCSRTLEIAKSQNLSTMMWSIAIVDWGKDPIDGQKSADKITSRLHPGAIILLHISNSGTVDMMEKLVVQMADKGYTAAQP